MIIVLIILMVLVIGVLVWYFKVLVGHKKAIMICLESIYVLNNIIRDDKKLVNNGGEVTWEVQKKGKKK